MSSGLCEGCAPRGCTEEPVRIPSGHSTSEAARIRHRPLYKCRKSLQDLHKVVHDLLLIDPLPLLPHVLPTLTVRYHVQRKMQQTHSLM